MKLEQLRIENFGPFVEADVKLADRGLVLILGDNQVSTAADSNGSGKSFILEAIVWAIYGKTIRYDLRGQRTADAIVNRHNGGKNCAVKLKVMADGSEIEINRYRKHKDKKNSVDLIVDGITQTKGTTADTDKAIEEVIGLDFKSFVYSVYFDGSMIVPFPVLSDKEIKEIFEKVLNLEALSKALDVVKGQQRAVNADHQRVVGEMAVASAKVATASSERLNADRRSVEFEHQRDAEIADIERQKAAMQVAGRALADVLAADQDCGQQLADAQAKIDRLAEIERQVASLDLQIQRLEHERTAAEQEVKRLAAPHFTPSPELQRAEADCLAQLGLLKRQIEDATCRRASVESQVGKPCRECGKLYEAGDLDHLRQHLADEVAQKTAEFAKWKEVAGDLWKRRRAEEQAAAAEQATQQATHESKALAAADALRPLIERRALMARAVAAKPALERRQRELQQHRLDLANEKAAIERRDEQLANLETQRLAAAGRVNPFTVDVQRWQTQGALCESELARLDGERGKVARTLKHLGVLETAYGRTGLKVHIFETLTPVLNARANTYASRLADDTLKITFSTVTRNKDGSLAERFSVQVVNDQGADGYLGNSAGERRKIDLAIALAMSDLVAIRSGKPIDFFAVDEVAEHLDATGIERLVEILQDKAKERGSLMCISHTDLRSHIANAMVVRKSNAGSIIA